MIIKYFEKIQQHDKTYIDSLFYEFEMLNYFANYPTKNFLEENAFLEAFLIHARNLIYFLSDEKFKDDVKISNFKDRENKQMKKIILDSELIGKDDKKINLDYIHKQVVHLSKKRTEEKFVWYKIRIKQEINGGLKKFIEDVNEEYFLNSECKKNDFLIILNR